MPKLYATAALILLLGFAFWYHGNQKYQSGVNAERVKWQDIALDASKKRAAAERKVLENSQKREVKLSEAKKQVYQAVADCYDLTAHHSVLRSLCETGRAPKSLCESPAVGYHLP